MAGIILYNMLQPVMIQRVLLLSNVLGGRLLIRILFSLLLGPSGDHLFGCSRDLTAEIPVSKISFKNGAPQLIHMNDKPL